MPITAQSIIRRVTETLQDVTSISWPVAELVRYFNDGQRDIVSRRPDALLVSGSVALVAGARQTLPASAVKLVDITRNTGGSKGVITQVKRDLLDRSQRGWQNIAGSAEILHYMYDLRDPKTFYVYPPATAAASIEAVYSALPSDIAEPADGSTFANVTGNLGLPDQFGNAIADYILFRAYTKDSESGNASRAQAHYALYQAALGSDISASAAVAPAATAG